MIEWMIEWMNVNEWMIEWMNVNEWMNEWWCGGSDYR